MNQTQPNEIELGGGKWRQKRDNGARNANGQNANCAASGPNKISKKLIESFKLIYTFYFKNY